MPYTTVVAGTTITASWGNSNVRDQVVTPFATTGARDSAITSPVIGMVEYISSNDVNEGLTTRNSANQWRQPWNLPWGIVTSASTTSATSLTTGVTADITGLSVTWTAVGNRRLRITVQCAAYATPILAVAIILADGAGTQLEISHPSTGSTTTPAIGGGCLSYIEAPASGSVTRKVRMVVVGTTPTGGGAATSPAFILVEDIGPSGAPA